MFTDYIITTASRHPSSLPCREDLSPSPAYIQQVPAHNQTRAFPRHMSISQLAQRFSEQRLHHGSSPDVRSDPFQADPMQSAKLVEPFYVGGATASAKRTQRQQGVRLLCDPSHLRSIQDMVERMVHEEEQCSVAPPRKISDLPDPKDDEGYSSLEDNVILTRQGSVSSLSSSSSCSLDRQYKRSSNISKSGASVAKSARVRKTRKSVPRVA